MAIAAQTGKWLDRLSRVARWLPGILRFRASVWLRRIISRGPVILVYRHAAMGDVICTFPAVRALREKYPGCFIVYATNRLYIPLVHMGQAADRVIECEEPLLRIHRIVDRDFTMALRPAYADETGGGGPSMHLVDEFARVLGVQPLDRQPHLHVPASLTAWVQTRFETLRSTGPVIGIHPGPTWGVRTWPSESWAVLTRLCRDRLGATIVQFGDTRVIPELGLCDTRIPGTIDWVGQLNIEQTVACVARCDVLVGIDSGLIHVAGAVGTPSVGIFGPTEAARRMPPVTSSAFVQSGVACTGCHHRKPVQHRFITCDLDIACMKSISPEAVFTQIERMLGHGRQAAEPRPILQGSAC